MSTLTPSNPAPLLAQRLANVRVGLRRDLEVSRHLFRTQPSYIIRDPLTFRTQRLDQDDYQVFVKIRSEHTLSQICTELIEQGHIEQADQESFYQFVFDLHRLGFLQLPIADSSMLYNRFESRRKAMRGTQMRSVFFLRIPLWNPDAFLNRTIQNARPCFGPLFFLVWLALMIGAGMVIALHWHAIRQPIQGLWAANNLPLIWATLIGLKVLHEFGHAYACKHFGGHVPEIGVYLILFTPCAYVDASASWGFSSKWQRLMVCLAGMYVESIIAALAVFVWAATAPSLLNSLAYNVIFLAGVTTILFNINPLMRYDGYYILSDWLEIPNLRASSQACLAACAKRLFLGIRNESPDQTPRLSAILLIYGVLAFCYRVLLIFVVAALLASKMFVIGLIVGISMAGASILGGMKKLYQYLWRSEETAAVRGRAIAWGLLCLAIIPTAAALIPLPATAYADGEVVFALERVIRAQSSGFLDRELPPVGTKLETGTTLAHLHSDALLEALTMASAELDSSRARLDAFSVSNPLQAAQEVEMLIKAQEAFKLATQRVTELTVQSPIEGNIVSKPKDIIHGSFVPANTRLLTVCGGRTRVRALLEESVFARVAPVEGDHVEFCTEAFSYRKLTGTIVRIAPHAGLSRLGEPSVDAQAGSSPDLADAPALRAFEIEVQLEYEPELPLQYGMTGTIRFQAESEPPLKTGIRTLLRFVHKLLAAN